MSDESKPEDQPEVASESPKEAVADDNPKRWWLMTTVMGRPHILEIVSVGGFDVNGLGGDGKPTTPQKPPEFGPDDDIVVDRGLALATVMGPGGQGQAYVDFRQMLSPMLIPSDHDLSDKANRRPVNFKGRSLLIGAYLWMDFEDAGEQFLQDQVQGLYSPVTELDKPAIVGVDGKPIGRQPGALGAIGQL